MSTITTHRAPRGRNETGAWWHRHDEYETSDGGN